MAVARFLREATLGETRWVALDAGDRPLALYLERHTKTAVVGAQLAARIGRAEPGAGGIFIEIAGSAGAFLRVNPGQIRSNPVIPVPSEGSSVTVEVISESRAGKLPRVKLVQPGAPHTLSGADAWRGSLIGGTSAPVEQATAGDSLVAAAFEDALAPDVTLPGGGRLRIDRTRALTAADIDSAGRAAKGSAAARALSLNREAAAALAREILLRGLGGLFVLDCVSPLTKETSGKVRDAFVQAWSGLSTRPARALPPSPLGLMELSTGWWTTPLADEMLDETGAPTPETVALDGLRKLEAAAQRDRMARLTLKLPEAALQWLNQLGLDADGGLAAKYGARLTIGVHAGVAPEVSPQA